MQAWMNNLYLSQMLGFDFQKIARSDVPPSHLALSNPLQGPGPSGCGWLRRGAQGLKQERWQDIRSQNHHHQDQQEPGGDLVALLPSPFRGQGACPAEPPPRPPIPWVLDGINSLLGARTLQNRRRGAQRGIVLDGCPG